jgi:hypothetical protein
MTDALNHVITLDDSIADTVRQTRLTLRINARTQELLRDNAAAYDYSPDKAREQAIADVSSDADEQDLVYQSALTE